MKALLAFAFLFVIATHASTPAYFLGFTEQIGLNGEQMKHGSVCFNTVHNILGEAHQLIQNKQAATSEIIRSVMKLVNDVEYKLKGDCSVYMNDILSTFFRNFQGGDLQEVAKMNWRTYTAEIVQQIAMYFDFIAARNDYEAGRTEAYIYQILFGLEKPKVLPLPVSNPANRVKIDPMDLTNALTNLTKGYFETLGLFDNKAVHNTVDCMMTYSQFPGQLFTIQHKILSAQNTTQKLVAYEMLINQLVRLHDSCVGAVTFDLQHILLPILGAFKVAPVHATLAVVHNVALNLPEMKQKMFQFNVHGEEGRLYEAGKTQAELLMTIFSNIYPKH